MSRFHVRLRNAASLALIAMALAIAMPGRAAAQTGAYGGLLTGYATSDLDTTKATPPPPALPPSDCPYFCEGSRVDSATGTVVAGYGLSLGSNLTAAVEADIAVFGFGGIFHSDGYESDWFATLRGLLGSKVSSDLTVFVTGGIGWLDLTTVLQTGGDVSETLTGWVAGLGGEYSGLDLWGGKLRFDYLYGQFEDQRFTVSGITFTSDPDIQQVRVGIVFPLCAIGGGSCN